MVQEWYVNYVEGVTHDELVDLILAANYLDIKPLLDLTCCQVACWIKDRTPEYMRAKFNIVSDFSPEEEARVREECKWALDALK